ncbi:MAG: MFS transporter [Luteitalea sp.]|nr:MFS transporter [Luteitalea sp.]
MARGPGRALRDGRRPHHRRRSQRVKAASRLEPASPGPPALSLNATTALFAFAVAVVVTTEFIVVGLVPMIARDLAISLSESGRLVTWFALSSAFLGPPLTIGVSKLEARPVLVVALLIFGLGGLAATVIPSYPILVAVRVVQGAALPVFVSVGSAAIARIAGPGRDGRALALINVGVIVGAVLAMPAGVLLADRAGWSASFVGLLGRADARRNELAVRTALGCSRARIARQAKASRRRKPWCPCSRGRAVGGLGELPNAPPGRSPAPR